MDINYTQLMLGEPLVYKEDPENSGHNIFVRSPTIKELAKKDNADFTIYTRLFTASIREIYSGDPKVVDQVEKDFPTIWDAAWDDKMSFEVSEKLLHMQDIPLLPLIVGGFIYWIGYDVDQIDDFQVLSNQKIVNKKLDWVIDKEVFKDFCMIVKCITLTKADETLIAPKNMSPAKQAIWKTLYDGRMRKIERKVKKTGGHSLGDDILSLEISSQGFIPMSQIKELTYYQLMNLLKGYAERDASDKEFNIYTSYKFDTEKMKIQDWREKLSLTKIKEE